MNKSDKPTLKELLKIFSLIEKDAKLEFKRAKEYYKVRISAGIKFRRDLLAKLSDEAWEIYKISEDTPELPSGEKRMFDTINLTNTGIIVSWASSDLTSEIFDELTFEELGTPAKLL